MQKPNAFTLVELLVVISIIALLAGLALPALNNARREGYKIQDVNNLKQVGLTIKLYSNDYDGLYPLRWDATKPRNEQTLEADAPQNSNEAFRALFGAGILKDERVFFTQGWTRVRKGDNNIGNPPDFTQALEKGENSFTYFAGLSEGVNSLYPLACNPWAGGPISYNENGGFIVPSLNAGIHGGTGINLLRVDGSVSWIPKAGGTNIKLGGGGTPQPEASIKVADPLL